MPKIQTSAGLDPEVFEAIEKLRDEREWPSVSYTINKALKKALLSN